MLRRFGEDACADAGVLVDVASQLMVDEAQAVDQVLVRFAGSQRSLEHNQECCEGVLVHLVDCPKPIH